MGILAWGVSSQAFPQPVESLPRLGDRCYMPTYRWRASCLPATRLEDSSALVVVLCGGGGERYVQYPWKAVMARPHGRYESVLIAEGCWTSMQSLWRDRVALGNRLHGAA